MGLGMKDEAAAAMAMGGRGPESSSKADEQEGTDWGYFVKNKRTPLIDEITKMPTLGLYIK